MRQIGCPARINKRVFAARVGAVKPRGRLRVRRVSNRNWPMFDIRLTTPDLDPTRNRRVGVYQTYWRGRAGWRPESWALSFGVFLDGQLVGYQGLEGDDFSTLRTVDSFSFLTGAVRGRGLGKQMRAAVLTLAFGPLGARFAITSAWSDNHASLGVSRAIGYVDNGVTADRRDDVAGEMAHLRLTRERWTASGWPEQVTVTGVEECMVFFGLG